MSLVPYTAALVGPNSNRQKRLLYENGPARSGRSPRLPAGGGK